MIGLKSMSQHLSALLRKSEKKLYRYLDVYKMNSNHIFIKMVLDRWNTSLNTCDKLLNELTDEQLQKEVAPGKNRGVYLLGHLIAVHDEMLRLLDMGEKRYPEWYLIFHDSPDRVVAEIPSVQEVKACWSNQCELIKQKFTSLPPEEWFEKHMAVSAEDFINEPHRNKLNIILTRTTHLNYHIGQLILLK